MTLDVKYDITMKTVLVYYNNKIIWRGHRENLTGLWILPLTSKTYTETVKNSKYQHKAYSAYAMTSKEAPIKYLHQFLFCPTKRTLIKAINNNQFTTWPGLTGHVTTKYLQDAPTTEKGHVKRLRQGIRSTKTKIEDSQINNAIQEDMNPKKITEKMNKIFCYSGHIDTKEGTIYVDLTGRFPIRSLK